MGSRQIKSAKGTIWNLEKLETNHIEIKSIGGENYHKEIDRIFAEFDKYVECFDCVFKNREPKYIEKLKIDHKVQINNSDKEKVAQFSSAVTEAGLLPE